MKIPGIIPRGISRVPLKSTMNLPGGGGTSHSGDVPPSMVPQVVPSLRGRKNWATCLPEVPFYSKIEPFWGEGVVTSMGLM